MIHIVLGTKAQLVKMAPVMVALRRREVRYRLIHTGQHQATMDEMLAEFGLSPPDLTLHHGRDVVSIPQMALWMGKILAACVIRRKEVFGDDRWGIVLVHGDTFSTLLGALMGRVAGLRVGHVESGLRSFNLFDPFPEEITRLLTFRLSHLLYCQGEWAMKNVAGLGRECVDTGGNTLADALDLALLRSTRVDHVPKQAFAIVSLHRYENIFRRPRFEELIGTVEAMARDRLVLFILHPPTLKRLEFYALRDRLEANERIELRPRYTYFDVIALMKRAEFIATDGGSIQEESSYLGVPCLVMRAATERLEGMGANAVLSKHDRRIIDAFLADPERYRRPAQRPECSPSERIIDSVLPYADANATGSAS